MNERQGSLSGEAKALAKCAQPICICNRQSGIEKPHYRHRLLRRSTTRPEDRSATNEPKELPSPHVPPRAAAGASYRLKRML
jgi:hypothetical protein